MANYILLFCLLTDDRKMCEFGSCGDEYYLYFLYTVYFMCNPFPGPCSTESRGCERGGRREA